MGESVPGSDFVFLFSGSSLRLLLKGVFLSIFTELLFDRNCLFFEFDIGLQLSQNWLVFLLDFFNAFLVLIFGLKNSLL